MALGYTPVIVLIEAVPAGAADLALAVAGALEAAGLPSTLIALDGQNRLGVRLGAATPTPAWCWNEAAPELLVQQGGHRVVPGCQAESDLKANAVAGVVHLAKGQSGAVVIDLGCRWEPGLFRPVLTVATHIWLVTRSGSWSGAEMRLEQAEFSGWTAIDRVKVVAVGASAPPSGLLTGIGVALLPQSGGAAAREFLLRELGRVPR